jgi:tetratricopeptide (TPR) repeat protein
MTDRQSPEAGRGASRLFAPLRWTGRLVTLPIRAPLAVRHRPRLAVLTIAAILITAALGAVGYAQREWGAAQADLGADRPQEALARLRTCLVIWPYSADVHRLAARAARMSGDLPAAEGYLNRCLKLQGGATHAVQLEFLLYRVQAGELDAVAPALIECVDTDHAESPVILQTLARAYMQRLRYKAAFACLSRWIELCPDAARPYQWRGWVLERLNQSKAAADDYHHALDRDPDLIPVRLRIAEMLLEDKLVPEALPYLEHLYRQAPENPRVLAGLGICRFYEDRPEEARRLLERAEVDLPKETSVLIHLARLDVQERRAADAERRLRQVVAVDPADTEALYTLATALQMQSRTSEAAACLANYQRAKERLDRANKLLREVADSPGATAADYAEVGGFLLDAGNERQGLYWLDRALERDPEHETAHRALAVHYQKKGDTERAAAHRRWLPESQDKK